MCSVDYLSRVSKILLISTHYLYSSSLPQELAQSIISTLQTLLTPRTVSTLKIGDYVILHDIFPCKIIGISTIWQAQGKGGYKKFIIFGEDIFSLRRYEEICLGGY